MKSKTEALKKVIIMILNGEKLPGLLMTIIRFVLPLQDHTIKKLLLVFWEIVPKTTPDGRLLHEMILVCDAYRKVSHPWVFLNVALTFSWLQNCCSGLWFEIFLYLFIYLLERVNAERERDRTGVILLSLVQYPHGHSVWTGQSQWPGAACCSPIGLCSPTALPCTLSRELG